MLTSTSFVNLTYFNSNDDLEDFKNFFSYHYNMRRLEIENSFNDQKYHIKKKSRRNQLATNQQSKKKTNNFIQF